MIDLHEKELGADGMGFTPVMEGAQIVAIITCPNNHRFMIFGEHSKHQLGPNGVVIGSVLCEGRPGKPCGWHEHIRLVEYGGEIA